MNPLKSHTHVIGGGGSQHSRNRSFFVLILGFFSEAQYETNAKQKMFYCRRLKGTRVSSKRAGGLVGRVPSPETSLRGYLSDGYKRTEGDKH